jgi:hypothetical protein
MAQLRNANAEKKADLIDPMGFYPWALSAKVNAPPPTAEEIAALGQAFPLTAKGR